MWCVVSLPNSHVIEVELDAKAKGEECLDQVCGQLGIIESDYFGLQYAGNKGEQLWLNMRNQLNRQMCGQPPYRLRLRVKFFVQPHFLIQDTTRNLFYLQVKQQFVENILRISEADHVAQVGAYIAQVELGDSVNNSYSQCLSYRTFLPLQYAEDNDLLTKMSVMHVDLRSVGANSAKYRMLQLVSSIEGYGMEYHEVRSQSGQVCHMGVGPEGISLYNINWELQRNVAYPTILKATHVDRRVSLCTLRDDGAHTTLTFQLVSDKAANGLYRCLTEKHSFYRCDTVRNAVASQFSRDLKGTLASIFNENTTLGMKYVFDIKRTCREAYDHARRTLYASGEGIVPDTMPVDTTHTPVVDDCQLDDTEMCSAKECQELKEKLNKMHDDWLCRVCMDANIDTTFCPCGHLVCCGRCADRLDTCPLCRESILQKQHIFVPSSTVTPILHMVDS